MPVTDLDLSFTPIAGGAFPDGYASRLNGGLHVAATTTDRNLIPDYRREEGMLCWVTDGGGAMYQLRSSPGLGVDADWELFSLPADTDIGGFHNVDTTTDRNDIPTGLREEGMLCWVKSTGTLYQLLAEPWFATDADWMVFDAPSDTNSGGLHIATTTTNRDAIPQDLYVEGMLCWVQADSTLYQLNAAPWTNTSTDWRIFNSPSDNNTGGLHIATSISARNAIDQVLYKEGMLCWVQSDQTLYQLSASPWANTSADWVVFSPPLSNIQGAVLVEDPSGTPVRRRLRAADVDPDFAITAWGKTAPNGATLLYRRGDTLTGVTGAATYVSGPPTSATVTNTLAGSTDVGDVAPGVWTINAPFASASMAGSVKRNGADAGADPTLTAALQAIAAPFTRNASWVAQWTSDIYVGVSALALVAGTDVFNVTLQAGFAESLQTSRVITNTVSPSAQYIYWLWPDEAQYTAGTERFTDTGTGFTFPASDVGSTSITRNGVTRTYRIWRSDNLQSSTFTIAVS